jgi:two-component system invasion response regulator UvrY
MLSHSPTPGIRVLCVDDQPVVRHSLALALMAYDDMELVGEAASGEEAVRLCATVTPEVILMDIVMPGMGGVAATRAIREQWPDMRVVGLTSFIQPSLLDEMRQAGALCCLIKTGSSEELVKAIRDAYCAAGNGYS